LRYPGHAARARFRADLVGAGSYAALLALVTLLLNALQGGVAPLVLAAEAAALAGCVAVFVWRQRWGPLPLAEWRLFRDRSYAAASAYILLSNLVMYTTLLTIPFFIKEIQHKGNGAAGWLLAAQSFLMAALAPYAGRLSDERGRRLPVVVGSAVAIAGVALLVLGIGRDVSLPYLAAALAVLGLGMGLSTGTAGTAAIEAAPRELAGGASGANSMMRYLGSIAGAGVLGAVLNSGADAPGIGVFRLIFAVLLPVAVAALVAALWIHRFVGRPSPPGPLSRTQERGCPRDRSRTPRRWRRACAR
jgi:DHA2 family methylenomycin A resistance protein-like MFS transporter